MVCGCCIAIVTYFVYCRVAVSVMSVIMTLPSPTHLLCVLSCGRQCNASLLHGTVGRSLVCDCGIALPYSLTLCTVVWLSVLCISSLQYHGSVCGL